MTEPSPQNPKNNSTLWTALGLAWDLGYIIALPIVILGFGGAYLDRHYETSPIFLLIGIGLALVITAFGVYKKMNALIQKLNGKK